MNLPVKYSTLPIGLKRTVREEYIVLQGGKCWYCKEDLKYSPPPHIREKRINRALFPPTFFKYPIHLHHDHVTDMTIGAVHNICNAVLWIYHNQ